MKNSAVVIQVFVLCTIENDGGKVIQLITTEIILENDLSKTVDIFMSEDEFAEFESCCKVYPI